ncbi:Lin0512 family protein [Microcoleus sp. herbarium14]|uniref:Lin0512 family protein n=1 Tax=Microcoleus sp. herbarium14 TaxID=3055439 RepID=UPI002FD46A88
MNWYYYFAVVSIDQIISIAVSLVDNCFEEKCDPLLQASLTTISEKSTKGVTVARKCFIIEMGMGIDQHGQEPTVACARAVRNAIAHNALLGVWEVAGLTDPNQMIVEVKVAVPYPEQVRADEVLAVLPFGSKTLIVEQGGMVVAGRAIASLNDKNDEMLIAVAAVSVFVDGED